MNLLFIGDIVGRPGRKAVQEFLPVLQAEFQIDLIIANGENAAGGFGINKKVAQELFASGIDIITLGNHSWDNKEILQFINEEKRILRPLNYNQGLPGMGWTVAKTAQGCRVGVINLLGQVFMGSVNSPFQVFNDYWPVLEKEADFFVVDFHAEASGEKLAFANFVAGKVAAVVGTHTHIQTADERILPGGTAYITDLGMTGAIDSILGMKKEQVLKRFLTQIPQRFSVAKGDYQLNGALVTFDAKKGKAHRIKRIFYIEKN